MLRKALVLGCLLLGVAATQASAASTTQILRDCGVQRMNLMGAPRRMPSMAGYGLEVAGYTPRANA